jgi:hypothetical protein
MIDIFEHAQQCEQARRIKQTSYARYNEVKLNKIRQCEAVAFFNNTHESGFDENNRIAKERNTFEDEYEEKHGRGADSRHPGKHWVYGVLV